MDGVQDHLPSSDRGSSTLDSSSTAPSSVDLGRHSSEDMTDSFFQPSSSSSSSGVWQSEQFITPLHAPHRRANTDPRFASPLDAELSFARHDGYDFNDSPPILRTLSTPLPSRVGTLLNPLTTRPAPSPVTSFSREIADAVQCAVQTLLHLSPPHLLDDVKEQYSGCGVQIPTTSMSALFSSLRNLNYLCAHSEALVAGQSINQTLRDFDLGEMIQGVADLHSGQAARQGVDLVLSNIESSIKLVSGYGDAEGLEFLVGHIVRQILQAASAGDTLDIGLSVESSSNTQSFSCTISFTHISPRLPESPAATPKAERNPFTNLAESNSNGRARLETDLCRHLLQQQCAMLDVKSSDAEESTLTRTVYGLNLSLQHGSPLEEPQILSVEEEAVRQPFPAISLPREPTMRELVAFQQTLRGVNIDLRSAHDSIFADHLVAALTAWGMEVTKLADGHTENPGSIHESSSSSKSDTRWGQIIMIDDDVSALRKELLRMRGYFPSLFGPRPPMLGRLYSSPLIRWDAAQQMGTPTLVHFTSLANYHRVRDTISAFFGAASAVAPSVIVIPKPVGPRRLLTALHTAVRSPPVDPSFSPIATSPRSPRVNAASSSRASLSNGDDHVRANGFAENTLPTVDTSTASDASPGDIVATPASEYFANGSRPAPGPAALVMQSPDGRPVGMYFGPVANGDSKPSFPQRASSERLRRRSTRRTLSANASEGLSPKQLDTTTLPRSTAESLPRPPSPTASKSKSLLTEAGPSTPPSRDRASTVSSRTRRRISSSMISPKQGGTASPAQKLAGPNSDAKHGNIVPPINVLIVEDNPINQNILSKFLRKKKIRHSSAKDGLEAVEKWRTGGFHLILMDIQLPVMDGIEATKRIRKLEKSNKIGLFPSTPTKDLSWLSDQPSTPSSPFRSSVIIVALTASSLQSDRVVALAAGCNDFLTKPVSLKWLERKIVEWGCMQALIDFDGWRRWKGGDGGDQAETERGFNIGPQQAAKSLASRLKIDRKPNGSRSVERDNQPTSLTSISEDLGETAIASPIQTVDVHAL